MKLILAQPAIPRFQWELEVLLTNISQWRSQFDDVILLFTEHDFTVPIYLRDKYGCSVFVYPDRRDDGSYIPSVRPYLWWRYLSEDPQREQDSYLYVDSDIIFREMIDFATLDLSEKAWLASDCSGYIAYPYIAQCRNGERIAQKMADITGITLDQLKNTAGGGAQWVVDKPTAAFWKRSYEDSNRIWHYLEGVDSDIQKWTAEMWAQLFGMTREGITVKTPAELDFCFATDDLARYEAVKIFHNAGVTGSGEYFFKGQYVDRTPFAEDFSGIRTDRATIKYVEAIKNVKLRAA